MMNHNTIEKFKTYKGSEFNKLTENKLFVRLTVMNENHNGYQYETGLNIDPENFNPCGQCNKGGFYFCEMNNFHEFIEYNTCDTCKLSVNIRQVSIPDDACVYVEDNKYKTNKFILGDAKRIFNDYELCLKAVSHYGKLLQHIENQTNELCLAAISQNSLALRYVKKQTPEICLKAVTQNGIVLQYVKEQTSEICLAAVKQNGIALRYVKEQNAEICLEAVKQNRVMIQYVKNRTPDIEKLFDSGLNEFLSKYKFG
jgi:hypothetical protein